MLFFCTWTLGALQRDNVYVFVDCLRTGLVDLAFVVDSSGSINYKDPRNWDITKEFLVNVTRLFNIGPDYVQVAVVLFSTDALVQWGLTRYRYQTSLINAIRRLPYLDGLTNLNDALYLTRTEVFAPGFGTRNGAHKAAIIVTDGVDNVPTYGTVLTLQNATACKNDNITLTTIGVSSQVNEDRLRQIASSPSWLHYFKVENFSALTTITYELGPKLCIRTYAYKPTLQYSVKRVLEPSHIKICHHRRRSCTALC